LRIGIDYRVARSHAPGVGRYTRELTRALVPLVSAHFELALLDLGTEPAVLDGSYLGLSASSPHVRRLRAFLPRSWLAPLSRSIGLSADRMLGGVELFHHTRAPHLPVRNALQTLAVSELPPAGTSAEAAFAAESTRMDGLFVFSAHYERELAQRFGISPRASSASPSAASIGAAPCPLRRRAPIRPSFSCSAPSPRDVVRSRSCVPSRNSRVAEPPRACATSAVPATKPARSSTP
jgi:hypothetical protein